MYVCWFNIQVQVAEVLDGKERVLRVGLHVAELHVDVELRLGKASVAQLELGGAISLALHALLSPIGLLVVGRACMTCVLVGWMKKDCEVG